jgi:hypothetical protein
MVDHFDYFVGAGGRNVGPVFVSPEVGERDSAGRFQRVFVVVLALVLALREKGSGAQDGEH